MKQNNKIPKGSTFVYDELSKKLDKQNQQIDALDLKTSFVFAIIGIIILGVVSLSNLDTAKFKWAIIAEAIILIIAIIFAFFSLKIREYKEAPEAHTLVNKREQSMEELKNNYLGNLLEAVQSNVQMIDRKVTFLRRSIISTFVAFLGVVFYLLMILL